MLELQHFPAWAPLPKGIVCACSTLLLKSQIGFSFLFSLQFVCGFAIGIHGTFPLVVPLEVTEPGVGFVVLLPSSSSPYHGFWEAGDREGEAE